MSNLIIKVKALVCFLLGLDNSLSKIYLQTINNNSVNSFVKELVVIVNCYQV